MSQTAPKDQNQRQRTLNLTMAALAGQVGFLTLAIIVCALIAGLWLDSQLGSKPLFLIIFMLASVPETLFVMYRVAIAATARIRSVSAAQETTPAPTGKEE